MEEFNISHAEIYGLSMVRICICSAVPTCKSVRGRRIEEKKGYQSQQKATLQLISVHVGGDRACRTRTRT